MFLQQSSSTSPSEGKLGHEYVAPPPLMVALFTAVFSFLPPHQSQLQLFEWPVISPNQPPQQVRSVQPPTAVLRHPPPSICFIPMLSQGGAWLNDLYRKPADFLGQRPTTTAHTHALPSVPLLGPTGCHAALLGPTGCHAALLGPTGCHAALLGPTGCHATLLGPTGCHAALLGPTGRPAVTPLS